MCYLTLCSAPDAEPRVIKRALSSKLRIKCGAPHHSGTAACAFWPSPSGAAIMSRVTLPLATV